ncbi:MULTISPECIES: hypothetical protein [Stenotrophomonas]|nr:hypothetical protein [Stenotrophomonas maltophilia]MBH1658686.1 hypothetical protein [Stenotrophomonas maltophilia]MBH1844315.1 hypothetical protein [Stenotrophomonas maltophilia]HEL3255672.1 hypothetical protein [Stenotrophomonas maltophilia]
MSTKVDTYRGRDKLPTKVGTHHLDARHEKTRHKGGFFRGDQQSLRIT